MAEENKEELAKATPVAKTVKAPAESNKEKPLTNKELKELKKKEKAEKRAASKQASGISIEKQQQQATAKREKKQQQREILAAKKNKAADPVRHDIKRSTLFGHLETTEERRASLLAVSSAITSTGASRITANGLFLPMLATTISSSTSQPSAGSQLSSNLSGSNTNLAGLAHAEDFEAHQMFNSLSLDDSSTFVPGTSSIIPNTITSQFTNQQTLASVKELVTNREMLHPAITSLTLDFALYKIIGSIPRCIAMLEAFQLVVRDYKTPEGTTLSRNLTSYLSHQIDFLKKSRPLSVTMGNAIRWLKQEISLIDPSTPDSKAKEELCDNIAQFARERVELADQLIIETASQHIEEGSTILTYGCSKVLTDLFLHNAINFGKKFQIVIVDSRPLFEGRKMAESLKNKGLNVLYVPITALGTVFNMDIKYVFLGAHSILSNGFLYSRVGTAQIAMLASRRNIPVLVCCESLKFSQRVQLDSVTSNELADPNDLVIIDSANPVQRRNNNGFLLQQFIKEREAQQKEVENNTKQNSKTSGAANSTSATDESKHVKDKPILADWEKSSNLHIFNIMYDLTPPDYIKKIITEFGSLPPSSVPVVLREYKASA
ncbi:unnamed protein product [Kluyveromyces dobzhanskii CBS 2104]|uniref:Translation initiation factor eIF2B subunit delta n=1 Tax=Kluyveromyces dobzhanskii CBS 2104 TaxID=1427455 RepID=A0A0A8LC75_9SACH|nr:unnamed protein product [Kluyveromyces dobzhanskii CBS 2104]